MADLTQKYLKSILHYCPNSGVFTWIKRTGLRISVGDVAGSDTDRGYIRIRISGRRYMAHRLVWLYVHGEFPENQIDHINGVTGDNSLVNLRTYTGSENIRNSTKRCDNTSGYKGVHWDKEKRKWRTQIGHGRKIIHLGRYKDIKDAAMAYNKKAVELFGEFARLNEV